VDERNAAMHSIGTAVGTHAQHIDSLWHTMLWVCGVMYVLVIGFLVLALIRHGRRRDADDPTRADQERGLSLTLAAWIGLIVLGLFGLTLFSYLTDRALAHAEEPTVRVKITAHQWWWEIEYQDAESSRNLRTANELHLPLGARAYVTLESHDVIHSFWVPNLHGKQDMIPGRKNDIALQPTQVGVYRGICGEFCGLQHSKMHLDVVVESQDDYAAWYERQLQAPPPPSDPLAQLGQAVFMSSACNMCHAISGTQAMASVGPDLSHIATRRSLAAGALPNNSENLRSWLANPQAIKPGNRMPIVSLTADQFDALTAYLGTLE
jgi:cytochrome c oxidase subunit II